MLSARIKQARLMRGLTLASLARSIGVTPQAINKIETGSSNPKSDTLLKLAKTLDITIEFLLREPSSIEIQPVFRKQRRTTIKQDKVLRSQILDWLERYIQLEHIVGMDSYPSEIPDGFPLPVSSWDDIEEAAVKLRKAWNLGDDSIANLISILEDRNFLVGEIETDSGFEACTFEVQNGFIRHVIITKMNIPGDRQRLSIAHELGHLLLRVDTNAVFDEEQAAFRFAAAFLVPKNVANRELRHRRKGLNELELLHLKHEYGMSMQAWIYRASDLGVITLSKTRELFIDFGKQGWRKLEPGPAVESEHPRRFDLLVLWALEENLITRSRASELLNEPFNAFHDRQLAQVGDSI